MGDRVNIAVQDNGKRVYFYGHWSGEEAPEVVRVALDRGRERWDDPMYLARIIFCDFVSGSGKGLSGFGISTELGDNEHPILVVNCDDQTVSIEPDPRADYAHCEPQGEAKSYSFTDYAALPEAAWSTLDAGLREEAETG